MYLPTVDHLPVVTKKEGKLIVEGVVIEGDASVFVQMDRYERQYPTPSEKPKEPKKKSLLDIARDKTDDLLLQHNRLVLLADQKQQALKDQLSGLDFGLESVDVLDEDMRDAIQYAHACYVDLNEPGASAVDRDDTYACIRVMLKLLLDQENPDMGLWLKLEDEKPRRDQAHPYNLHALLETCEEDRYEFTRDEESLVHKFKRLEEDKEESQDSLDGLVETIAANNLEMSVLRGKMGEKSWQRFFCGWGEDGREAQRGLWLQEIGEIGGRNLQLEARKRPFVAKLRSYSTRKKRLEKELQETEAKKAYCEAREKMFGLLLGRDSTRRDVRSGRLPLIQGVIAGMVQPLEAELEVIENLRQRTMKSLDEVLAKLGRCEMNLGPFDRHFAEKALKSAMSNALMLE